MLKSKGFKKMMSNIEDFYTGKSVPPKYQKQYGKRYSKNEAKQIAYAVAKSRGMKV